MSQEKAKETRVQYKVKNSKQAALRVELLKDKLHRFRVQSNYKGFKKTVVVENLEVEMFSRYRKAKTTSPLINSVKSPTAT